MLRVLMLSKACLVGTYQKKLELIAAHPSVSALQVLVPPFWRDERGIMPLERVHEDGYDLNITPMRFNGSFHFHYYPELGRLVREFQPDILHIDEEPYNLATWLALHVARKVNAKTLFFTWQNINRTYPIPFRWLEQWTLRTVDYAIAGTESAAQVYREKGYTGRMAVIPQFGVDPERFAPPTKPKSNDIFQIGYVGRLVYEKGIDLLIEAVANLQHHWHLTIIGSGPEKENLCQQVQRLNLQERVTFIPQIPSTELAAQYHKLDVLVIPSRTMPNWKEQFGRVIIEAMASCVPVIGSDSGAIPDVIGDGGLIFQENDIADLADKIVYLILNPAVREQFAQRGRQRVLEHFTQAQVAENTVKVYEEMLKEEG